MIDEISHMEIEPVDDKHGPLAMTLTFGPPWKRHVVFLFSRDSCASDGQEASTGC